MIRKISVLFFLIILTVGCTAAEENTSIKTQVVVLGGIHEAHHRNPHYTPDVIKDIIVSLKPAAILNELPLRLVDPNGRPIEDVRDKVNSWPEIWAADSAAVELKVRQIPFDRPDRDENYVKTDYYERERRANELAEKWQQQVLNENPDSIDLKIAFLSWSYAMTAESVLCDRGTPDIINSEAHDSILRIRHSVWFDILPSVLVKYPEYEQLTKDYHFSRSQWRERNEIMAENITKAAKQYPGKRIVVITGATHRYILRDLLRENGKIDLKEFWEVQPNK